MPAVCRSVLFPGQLVPVLAGALFLSVPAKAQVVETVQGWVQGNWSLTVGASTAIAPRYRGAAGSPAFFAQPIISLGRTGGRVAPFVSRNDNISFALVDTGMFRAGPVGRILFARDDSDRDLKGLGTVRWGGELGVFADFYATSWLRLRGELRQGIRAHSGLVASGAVDAFWDVTPTLRLSGGPRITYATESYFRSYFGVNAAQATASGLSFYRPGSGLESVGFGGALTWKATDRITTSLFAEYARLAGPAAASSLVKERGGPDQYLIGISATYRFDFSM